MTIGSENRLIVALDVPSLPNALELTRELAPTVKWFKIGKEFFTSHGPKAVEAVREEDTNIFLDLKYMDIPNTVYRAVLAASELNVGMVTVHTSGGPAMLQAATEAAQHSGTMVIGVTVLTSMDQNELNATGVQSTVAQQVERLAILAKDAGLDGVVCSPREIERLRAAVGPFFRLVVPGIRPKHAQRGDQKRTLTPREAMNAGADHIVVGRPITAANDPLKAAQNIAAEMEG